MAFLRDSFVPLVCCFSLAACSGGGEETGDLFEGLSVSNLCLPARLPINDLIPLNAVDTITGFSISPELPAGLTLDTATGVISGTPEGLSEIQTYTLTATDGTSTDEASVTIAIRPPIIRLNADRELVIAEQITGNPVSASGAGVGLLSSAPTVTVAPQVAVTQPRPSVPTTLVAGDVSLMASESTPSALDVTTDFTATITIDDAELASGDPWQFSTQAPYDDDGLMPDLQPFSFDTANVVVVDDTLVLNVELPAASIGPFSSGSLPTQVRTIEPLTQGIMAMESQWYLVNGAYYAALQVGMELELYRYEPDGGAGAEPLLELACDLDPNMSGDAEIRAVIAGRLIVDMRDANGVVRTHVYDPINDTLVEIAGLAGGGDDVTSDFVDFDGVLYFVGEDATGRSGVYRYQFGSRSLQRTSNTASGASENPIDLRISGGMLYFLADNDAGDRHLYRFDPIFMVQERLSDDAVAPLGRLVLAGDRILVTGRNAQGAEKLFRLELFSSDLVQVANTMTDPSISDDVDFRQDVDGALYFVANRALGVRKLFRYSEAEGSGLVEQVSDTAGPSLSDSIEGDLVQVSDQLFFVAASNESSSKLFAFDLTTGATSQVCNVNTSDLDDEPSGLIAAGDQLAFNAVLQPSGHCELFTFTLETGETLRLADINPAASDEARPLFVVNGAIVFGAAEANGQSNAYVVR